jgi:hypothetical protein
MPPPNDPPGLTTARGISALTLRVIANREQIEMSRLADKLAQAGGVAGRLTAKIEARADELIAREAAIEKRTDQVFAPHEALMDSAERGLDEVEKKLPLLSNDPLPASAALAQGPPAAPPPVPPPSHSIGSQSPDEPGGQIRANG